MIDLCRRARVGFSEWSARNRQRLRFCEDRLRSAEVIAYVYAPDRKAERPIAHLAGFTGILQVDGYAGYRSLTERGDVQLAF